MAYINHRNDAVRRVSALMIVAAVQSAVTIALIRDFTVLPPEPVVIESPTIMPIDIYMPSWLYPRDYVPLPKQVPRKVLEAPKPINSAANWVTPNDYPSRDLREGNEGITGFKLIVGANGRVEDCMITRSSGFAGLDQMTCDRVSKRARFKPAIDQNGQPMASEYMNTVGWVIPE